MQHGQKSRFYALLRVLSRSLPASMSGNSTRSLYMNLIRTFVETRGSCRRGNSSQAAVDAQSLPMRTARCARAG